MKSDYLSEHFSDFTRSTVSAYVAPYNIPPRAKSSACIYPYQHTSSRVLLSVSIDCVYRQIFFYTLFFWVVSFEGSPLTGSQLSSNSLCHHARSLTSSPDFGFMQITKEVADSLAWHIHIHFIYPEYIDVLAMHTIACTSVTLVRGLQWICTLNHHHTLQSVYNSV